MWAGAVDRDPGDGGAAARALLRELPDDVDAVGHRIVHGGPRLHAPAPLTDEVKAAVRAVSELAPLHNAAGLEGVAVAEERFADVPQVAVFDTAFHARLARGGAHLRRPARVGRARAAPLRLPRHQPRVRGAARRAPARPAARTSCG